MPRATTQQCAIARDNYLRAADTHRKLATGCKPYSSEQASHERLAARFNIKAEEMNELLVIVASPTRSVQL